MDEIRCSQYEYSGEMAFYYQVQGFQDKYLYYTLINEELVLCHVKNIPDYERGDMFNSTDANQEAMKSIKKIKKVN